MLWLIESAKGHADFFVDSYVFRFFILRIYLRHYFPFPVSPRRAQLWTKPINLNKKKMIGRKSENFNHFTFIRLLRVPHQFPADGSWDFFKIKFLSHFSLFFSFPLSISRSHTTSFSLSLSIVHSLSFLFEVKFNNSVLFKNPFSASNHLKRKLHNFFFRRRALSLSLLSFAF